MVLRGETTPTPGSMIRGLAGLAVIVLIGTGFGVPLLGGPMAIEVLLVLTGHHLARIVLKAGDRGDRVRRTALGYAGRIYGPLLTVIGLVTVYTAWDQGLDEPRLRALVGALTMTLNQFMIHGGADLPALRHLAPLGVAAQFALIAPVLVRGGQDRLNPTRRAAALVGLGLGLAVCRLGVLLTGTVEPTTVALSTILHLDGLLVGLGIGVMPRREIRRRYDQSWTGPAFITLLVVFLLTPPADQRPTVTLGVITAVTVAASGALLAAALSAGSPQALTRLLTAPLLTWAGSRIVGIYLWYNLYAVLILDGPSATDTAMFFTVQVALTLAAATANHRYVEQPSQFALSRL